MKEHESSPPYWQQDLLLGEARIHGERTSLRLRLHTSEESYHGRAHELVTLSQPLISLSVALTPEPTSEELGTVMDSQWEGFRHEEVGAAQVWFYPADRLLVLWEAYLFEPYTQPDPPQDSALATLWTGFEAQLVDRFPTAERIVTPDWEDPYEGEQWQAFLRQQGYQPFQSRVFAKALPSPE